MRTGALVVVLWLAAHVLLVAASVLEVFVYSILVAPGLDNAAYQAHAQLSAPWVSIVVGGPVFFAWGRILRRALPTPGPAAVGVWALYSAADFAIITASGAWAWGLGAQWVASQSIKAAGIALGVRRR